MKGLSPRIQNQPPLKMCANPFSLHCRKSGFTDGRCGRPKVIDSLQERFQDLCCLKIVHLVVCHGVHSLEWLREGFSKKCLTVEQIFASNACVIMFRAHTEINASLVSCPEVWTRTKRFAWDKSLATASRRPFRPRTIELRTERLGRRDNGERTKPPLGPNVSLSACAMIQIPIRGTFGEYRPPLPPNVLLTFTTVL